MAAYAALVSLTSVIEQIQHHPRPPISLDKIQAESLTEKITFFQEFLEGYSQKFGYRKEADPLEMRISDAAYAAEDVIESHIVHRTLAPVDLFHQCLGKVIDKNMDSFKKELMEYYMTGVHDQLLKNTMATDEDEVRTSTDDENAVDPIDQLIDQYMDSLKKEVMETKEKSGVRDQLLINTMPTGSFRSSTESKDEEELSPIDQFYQCLEEGLDEFVDCLKEKEWETDEEVSTSTGQKDEVSTSNHIDKLYQSLEKVMDKNVNLLKDVAVMHFMAKTGVRCQLLRNSMPTGSLRSTTDRKDEEEVSRTDQFYQCLQKVIEDMDWLKKEVMEIKHEMEFQNKLQRSSAGAAGSLRYSSTGQKKTTMVGFDDVLLEILDKLTGGQCDRQIIPIVGMGGMGKTTLARNLYAKPLIKEYFDICGWVTISQECNTLEILRDVLSQVNIEGERNLSVNELGEILYKHLSGRRYLVVMDDMWSIEVWDDIKFFFPEYNNGSRIVVTTRLSNLALQLTNSYSLKMKFLDEGESWDLFCKTVFEEEGCPFELEKIGKEIIESCKGLPLSIVVIGGLLAKSKDTPEYWQYIAENLNYVVNSEDNESCLQILYMSYNHLPIYLKSCFLYMGVFEEDSSLPVFMLTNLWVAEGFIKPVSGKSSEDIAVEYLMELIDRNLLLVDERESTGKVKTCCIHDLLRDLCNREAQKEMFYNVIGHRLNIPKATNTHRRFIIPDSISEHDFLDVLPSMSLARFLMCNVDVGLVLFKLRLVRILIMESSLNDDWSLENIFQLVNARFLLVEVDLYSEFPSSVCLLWNLQTLLVENSEKLTAPAEIWNIPQLRHVLFSGGIYLPDPPTINIDEHEDIVLENLQTLVGITNFNCGEEVIKRIPNIKKLNIIYEEVEGMSRYCLNNLERLHKLESFTCKWFSDTEPSGMDYLQNLTFPLSLNTLSLKAKYVYWEDMLEKIGSLPLLEKLSLKYGFFKGRKWETTEGKFHSLKFLKISGCDNLEYWTTDSSHLPRLEHLVLGGVEKLKKIPSEIGEIPTLKSIELRICSESTVISAKEILEEQEELYGEVSLQVRVEHWKEKKEALEKLASPNFQVTWRTKPSSSRSRSNSEEATP